MPETTKRKPTARNANPRKDILDYKNHEGGKLHAQGKDTFNQNYAGKLEATRQKRTNYHFVGVSTLQLFTSSLIQITLYYFLYDRTKYGFDTIAVNYSEYAFHIHVHAFNILYRVRL